MSDCPHSVAVKLTGARGKTKSFCAECLWELKTEAAAQPASDPATDQPYNQETVKMLRAGTVTDWEAEFISSLGKMQRISPKQQSVWNKIVLKYFPSGMPKDAPLEIPFGEPAPF